MSIGFNNNNGVSNKLANNLERAQNARADSMEKIATGTVFSSKDPQPATRALADHMDFRIRGLSSAKRNVNDAVSLLQTAESGLSEISNIVVRLKELNISGATTSVTDRDRRFLLLEYDALHDELNRIAKTTEFNGMPLLNGDDVRSPEQLIFRVDSPFLSDSSSDDDDINLIRMDDLKSIVSTTEGLGLAAVKGLLNQSNDVEGISIDDLTDLLTPQEDGFATVYDEALNKISTQRATFGAVQSRLQRSLDYIDVYQENIASAKSNISDTDYAQEIVKLTQSNIMMQAASGLLAQSNFDTNITLNLLSSVAR